MWVGRGYSTGRYQSRQEDNGGEHASNHARSSGSKTRDRVRNLTPSGASSEKPAAAPGHHVDDELGVLPVLELRSADVERACPRARPAARRARRRETRPGESTSARCRRSSRPTDGTSAGRAAPDELARSTAAAASVIADAGPPSASSEEAQLLRAVAHQQVLGLLVVVEHHPVVLAADARLLVAAERRVRRVGVVAVGPHAAGLDAAAHAEGRC